MLGSVPFLQHPGLADANLRSKPWTQIALERVSGNAKLLFDHSMDDLPGVINAAEAARHLVALLQFTNGGLVKTFRTSATRGPASNLACVLPQGMTLAETLSLNLLPQSQEKYDEDVPPWESKPVDLASLKQTVSAVPCGPAQRYAWITRVIQMVPSYEGISAVRMGEGVDLEDGPVPDPMVAITTAKDGEMISLKLDPAKAFWRDMHALAPNPVSRPPAVLANALAILAELGRSSRKLRIAAGGLAADKAKLIFWRLEEHQVPISVLAQGAATAQALSPAADRADEVARTLHGALFIMCENWLSGGGVRDPDKAAIRTAADGLQVMPQYWQDIEPAYWRFIEQLGNGDPIEQCLQVWDQALLSAAKSCWRDAIGRLGHRARALTASAQAGSYLAKNLRPKYPTPVEA